MELDPISPDFWVPFPRTRFSIGLPTLWLRLIEARHWVEERKGERTGATPPFWGCLRVRTHFSFPMCGCGHGAPRLGSLPCHLSLREGSDSDLIIGGTAKTKWRQIALVGGGPKASMGVVVFGRNRNRDIQP